MSQVVNAVYENGVLTPVEKLDLSARTRVWLIVQPADEPIDDWLKAWAEFEKFVEENGVDSGGERLTRDQLHERH